MPLGRSHRRFRGGLALLFCAALAAGCGDGEDPAPSGSAPSASTDPSAQPSAAPTTPAIEPATGPVLKVEAMKSSSQLRLPEGYKRISTLPMYESDYDKGAELADIELYTFVNTAYPADTDELAKLWKSRDRTPFGPPARRQPDEIVDATYALHLTGPGDDPGEFVEAYQVISGLPGSGAVELHLQEV